MCPKKSRNMTGIVGLLAHRLNNERAGDVSALRAGFDLVSRQAA
jgi:hypothetical protein